MVVPPERTTLLYLRAKDLTDRREGEGALTGHGEYRCRRQ